MSSEAQRPVGGDLNAAITRVVAHIHSQYVGRGPTKAQTFYRGPVVVTVLEDVMTKAERSLVAGGECEIVLAMRQKLQSTMRAELVSEIEQLTERKVIAFMSDNHVDPDLEAHLFILDRAVACEDGGCGGQAGFLRPSLEIRSRRGVKMVAKG